ncbi:hypothetical protein [Streptomyces sp. NPDC016845]|uniref:DUF7507 domain-containing protein n=1 Tax=Streptomyces sp. NPDC016845 TaxID=3364972 RepID=UPI0037AEF603
MAYRGEARRPSLGGPRLPRRTVRALSAVALLAAAALPQAVSVAAPPAPRATGAADSPERRAPRLRAAGPLQLEKTVTPDPLTVGDTAVYTLVVTNTGDQTAHDVTVADTLDSHLALDGKAPDGCTVDGPAVTCGGSGTDLAPGASHTYRIPVRVRSDTSDGTNIVNESTATSSDAQSAQARTITIAQTLTNVVLEKSGPAQVNADGTFTYTFTVTNEGPSDAVDVTVQDNTDTQKFDIVGLPPECPPSGATISCPLHTLKPGETHVFTVTVHAHADLADGTEIVNCADVYTGSRETQTADNDSCVTTTVDTDPTPTPTPTPTDTGTPTTTPTDTPTPTPTGSPTPTPNPTDSPTPLPTDGALPSASSAPGTPDDGELAGTGTLRAGLLGGAALLLAVTGVWLLRLGKTARRSKH